MNFLATARLGQDHTGTESGADHAHGGRLASLGHGLRGVFAHVGGGQVRDHLTPSLGGLRRRAADGVGSELGVTLSLTNTSHHTVEYELVALHMTVEGHESGARGPCGLHGELAPGRTALLAECVAAVAPLNPGSHLEASIEISLHYGLPGAARLRLEAAYAIAFKTGPADEIAAFNYYPV